MMRVRRSGESHVSWGRSFLRRWVGCQLENGWLMVEKMWFCVGTQRVCYATPPAHSVDIVHRQSAINIIVHYQSYESRGIPRAILGLSTPCGISYRDEQQCDGVRIRDSPHAPHNQILSRNRGRCAKQSRQALTSDLLAGAAVAAAVNSMVEKEPVLIGGDWTVRSAFVKFVNS